MSLKDKVARVIYGMCLTAVGAILVIWLLSDMSGRLAGWLTVACLLAAVIAVFVGDIGPSNRRSGGEI